MVELKTKPTKTKALDVVKKVSNKQRREDGLVLLKIFKEVTGKSPIVWGKHIIGYGMYHYKSERSSQEGDWPLTGFSVRKQNLSLYVYPYMVPIKDLLKKLGKHKASMGCLYINKLSDVDIKVLKQIIKKTYLTMKKKFKA